MFIFCFNFVLNKSLENDNEMLNMEYIPIIFLNGGQISPTFKHLCWPAVSQSVHPYKYPQVQSVSVEMLVYRKS